MPLTATGAEPSPTSPDRLLLRRRATVYLTPDADPADGTESTTHPVPSERPDASIAAGVDLLEADLVTRGWLLTPRLRDALLALEPTRLVRFGTRLLADCDALLDDPAAIPAGEALFAAYPTSPPPNPTAVLANRLIAAWSSALEAPCALCGKAEPVEPIRPCAHLLCRGCRSSADTVACPVCHRGIEDGGFAPTADRAGVGGRPRRLRALRLGTDRATDVRSEVLALLGLMTARWPGDGPDLTALLSLLPRAELATLPARPEQIPGRTAKARLLARLLDEDSTERDWEHAAGLVDSATDVLRLLHVRSGGGHSLTRARPRLVGVPRRLRRALLAILDRFDLVRLVDDLRRHRRAWIAVGEKLHPGEYGHRYRRVALAFAALRGTNLHSYPHGYALARYAATVPGIDLRDGRVVIPPWRRRVEYAVARRDVEAATEVLLARPDELVRRLDHLLRIAITPTDQTRALTALEQVAADVAPETLVSALGTLRTRTRRRTNRVFFPATRASTHVLADARGRLSEIVVGTAVGVLRSEILRRAGRLPHVDTAVVDTGLDDLAAPFGEPTAARPLVTLPRGSALAVPEGRYLRMFCHWSQRPLDPPVDLDLSVALYDEAWRHLGTCDYTSLRIRGAAYSGDVTRATGPLGASEFIDLDLPAIAETGARYTVLEITSYTDVPLVKLPEAFAGFLVGSSPLETGPLFDPHTVERRFDLTGRSGALVPLVLDLATKTVRWYDVPARVTAGDAIRRRHPSRLGMLGAALTEAYACGTRITLGEVARWHAAARARTVLLRGRDGDIRRLTRSEDEPVTEFCLRLDECAADVCAGTAVPPSDDTAQPSDTALPADAARADLQLLIRGDLPTPVGAEAYAMYPATLDAETVQLLTASELVTGLEPARRG